jgi:hypothetical protein
MSGSPNRRFSAIEAANPAVAQKLRSAAWSTLRLVARCGIADRVLDAAQMNKSAVSRAAQRGTLWRAARE